MFEGGGFFFLQRSFQSINAIMWKREREGNSIMCVQHFIVALPWLVVYYMLCECLLTPHYTFFRKLAWKK